METELLQKWARIDSGTGTLSITQDEEEWLDVSGFADAVFWVDVRQLTGTASGVNIFLNLESAPSKDELLFAPAAPPVQLAEQSTPLVARTTRGSVSVSPLARWLRWRLSIGATPSGAWGATFRVRVNLARTPLFSPTELSGCQLWLRSDLGISPLTANSGTFSTWTDQSGQNNGPTAVHNTVTYKLNGINGLPYVVPSSNPNGYFTGALAGSLGASHTLFVVTNVAAPGAASGMFAATSGGTLDTAFSLWFNSTPSIVGRTSNGTLNADAATTSTTGYLSNLTIYATDANAAANTSDLYLNGAKIATAALTFTPGTPNAYALFARDGAGTGAIGGLTALGTYEFLFYNRQLSAAEITAVHRYLGGRYGIAVP